MKLFKGNRIKKKTGYFHKEEFVLTNTHGQARGFPRHRFYDKEDEDDEEYEEDEE